MSNRGELPKPLKIFVTLFVVIASALLIYTLFILVRANVEERIYIHLQLDATADDVSQYVKEYGQTNCWHVTNFSGAIPSHILNIHGREFGLSDEEWYALDPTIKENIPLNGKMGSAKIVLDLLSDPDTILLSYEEWMGKRYWQTYCFEVDGEEELLFLGETRVQNLRGLSLQHLREEKKRSQKPR